MQIILVSANEQDNEFTESYSGLGWPRLINFTLCGRFQELFHQISCSLRQIIVLHLYAKRAQLTEIIAFIGVLQILSFLPCIDSLVYETFSPRLVL